MSIQYLFKWTGRIKGEEVLIGFIRCDVIDVRTTCLLTDAVKFKLHVNSKLLFSEPFQSKIVFWDSAHKSLNQFCQHNIWSYFIYYVPI